MKRKRARGTRGRTRKRGQGREFKGELATINLAGGRRKKWGRRGREKSAKSGENRAVSFQSLWKGKLVVFAEGEKTQNSVGR